MKSLLFLISSLLPATLLAFTAVSNGQRKTSSIALAAMSSRRGFFGETTTAAGLVVGAATTVAPSKARAAEIYSPPPNSLTGQIMVITGASTGLGLESAKRLAAAGATVVLTTRTENKGEMAIQAVQEAVPNAKAYYVLLDLDNLDSVKGFKDRLEAKLGKEAKIDVLMNNAGVMAVPDLQLTKDGYERTFQSNHLGHFVLTSTLMGKLASHAKVINVSSLAYNFAAKGLEFDNLNGETSYGPWSSYGQSKLANIAFTQELQKRANAAGRSIEVYSLHPGAVQTDLARNMYGPEKWETMKAEGLSGWNKILMETMSKFILTVEEGASTQVYLAANNVADHAGEFYDNMKPTKVMVPISAEASERLWSLSEKLGKIEFKL